VFRSLLRGWPLQLGLYHSTRLRKCLHDYLEAGQFDLLHLQLARLHSVAPAESRVPVVMDMVDALSLNMHRRAQQERWPARWLFRFEASRLATLEAEALRRFRRLVVVSEADRKALGDAPSIDVIPNGVDSERFRFQSLEGRKPEAVVFSGNMSYFPNVDAATWFIEAVLPSLLQRRPGIEFVVAGANPHPSLRRLAESHPSVVLTGFVPKMEDVLASATLAVAPMRSGTGIQNKVIEAMASGLPVVASPFALGGLSAQDGSEICVARDEQAFVDQILGLLDDAPRREAISVAARKYVERVHSWGGSVARLEDSYRSAREGWPARIAS
jgi:glycosyltransferase involved in cell wall biosynthesis